MIQILWFTEKLYFVENIKRFYCWYFHINIHYLSPQGGEKEKIAKTYWVAGSGIHYNQQQQGTLWGCVARYIQDFSRKKIIAFNIVLVGNNICSIFSSFYTYSQILTLALSMQRYYPLKSGFFFFNYYF